MNNFYSTEKNYQKSAFEKRTDESGTAFLFGKHRTKKWTFEKKSNESGTAFLFGKPHRKNFSWS